MKYIATFYSHFGAIRFKKLCEKEGIAVNVMPVPRTLSSSCGTCASYDSQDPCPLGSYMQEIEQVVEVLGDKYNVEYRTIYRAEGS